MKQKKITIHVSGVAGVGFAKVDYLEWLGMSPVGRVLKLHELICEVLVGEKFDVIRSAIDQE